MDGFASAIIQNLYYLNRIAMAIKNATNQLFGNNRMREEELRSIKGGYKQIPGLGGGVSSTGLLDWGEIEIRLTGLNLTASSGREGSQTPAQKGPGYAGWLGR